MKVKVPYNWKEAVAPTFNQDRVRRAGVSCRAKKMTVFVDKKMDGGVSTLKTWFKVNDVSDYSMFGVFETIHGVVYYSGLRFEFTNADSYILFRLAFE